MCRVDLPLVSSWSAKRPSVIVHLSWTEGTDTQYHIVMPKWAGAAHKPWHFREMHVTVGGVCGYRAVGYDVSTQWCSHTLQAW